MTKEEIYKTIENGKWNIEKGTFGKCKTSEVLLFIAKNNVYCTHGVRYNDGIIELVFSKAFPEVKTYRPFDELPYKEIETMKPIWFSELMEKYGGIYNAMKSIGED